MTCTFDGGRTGKQFRELGLEVGGEMELGLEFVLEVGGEIGREVGGEPPSLPIRFLWSLAARS